jgi:hypothetical protein
VHLPILNHDLWAILLIAALKVILGGSLGGADRLLVLSVVKAVRLTLLHLAALRWWHRIAHHVLVVLIIYTPAVLIEHFAGAVHRTGDAIDLLLIWPSQGVVA